MQERLRSSARLEELADLLDRKAELPGVADEAEAVDLRPFVGPVVARRTAGRGQEPDPLVVADRLDLGRGRRREIPDPETARP